LQDLLGSDTSLNLKKIKGNTVDTYKDKKDKKSIIIVLSGDVEATTVDGATLICDKMEVYYKYIEEIKDYDVDRVIATGDVKIDKPGDDKILAVSITAERVEYNKADEEVIFSGSPVLRQGKSIMKASEITYDIKEEAISGKDFEGDLVSGGER